VSFLFGNSTKNNPSIGFRLVKKKRKKKREVKKLREKRNGVRYKHMLKKREKSSLIQKRIEE
jgi:hypothetical protein